ncbi:MAG: chaperonin GroEL [Planctomycetota bacterium]
MSKQLMFEAEAREALKRGVQKLAKAVKSTLGPRGRTVVIDRGFGGPTITKDGYTVADEIDLSDPYENLGAQLLKEAADKTNDVAGDGTTTSTVLAEAIFVQGLKALTAGADATAVQRGIAKARDAVVKTLAKQAKKISLDDKGQLVEIASIASNNDASIGKPLVEAFLKIGADGVVNVEEGKGTETEVNIVDGMQFDRGYLSPHFVTDQKTLECEQANPYVLIHEEKISNIKKLIPLLEQVAKANRPLLIIAEDIEGEALATLVVNRLRGTFEVAAVKAPGYGDRRKAMLQDLAILTGAKPIFKDLAIDVESLTLKDLGSCKKVISTADTTTIVQGKGSKAKLQERIAQIRQEIESTDSNYDTEKLQERLARLAGGIAVMSIGAGTETEMKEKKARAKDALAATRAAIETGVLPGGGVALARCRKALDKLEGDVEGDEAFGVRAMQEAILAPLRQIADNAGGNGSIACKHVLAGKGGWGYNALTDCYEDLFEAGVIDPTKVTTSAVINAASVATILLSTNALVTDIPKDEAPAGDPGGDMGGMGGMPGMGGMGGGMPGMGGMGGMGGMPGMGF